jgi:hypothetical protein
LRFFEGGGDSTEASLTLSISLGAALAEAIADAATACSVPAILFHSLWWNFCTCFFHAALSELAEKEVLGHRVHRRSPLLSDVSRASRSCRWVDAMMTGEWRADYWHKIQKGT